MVGFIIAGFVVLVAAVIGFSIYVSAKRRKALMEWAEQNGLSFSSDYQYRVDEEFPDFSTLRQGEGRYAYNTMTGDYQGRSFRGFDYHYETYSTDKDGKQETSHHYFSGVILGSEVPLKPLRIRPENFFDKFTQFLGFDDINFESAEFSSKFHVSGPDRKWAFDVLHARSIEFLLGRPQWTIELGQGGVCVTMGLRCFDPAEFAAAADTARGLLDLLPQYVKEQQADLAAGVERHR